MVSVTGGETEIEGAGIGDAKENMARINAVGDKLGAENFGAGKKLSAASKKRSDSATGPRR